MDKEHLYKILNTGTVITSSGTTGTCKKVFQPVEKLQENNKIAIDVQKITKKSKILTVCRMTHAGGLLAQTLPAFSIGAEYTVTNFNAFNFLKTFQKYTHTFLDPDKVKALLLTKSFKTCNLDNKIILMGSDKIPNNHVIEFLNKGATVICNWGMSEVGPVAINSTYTKLQQFYEDMEEDVSVLGKNKFCDVKIVDEELVVRGTISVYKDWFYTGDKVTLKNNKIYYVDRLPF